MPNATKQKIGELECVIVRNPEIESPRAAVILCHGFGAPSTDLVSLAPEFMSAGGPAASAVYIFPGAPVELDPMFDSRAWWMIDIEKLQQLMERNEFRDMRNSKPDRLPICREMIFEIIEFVKQEYSLPANRIIVGGFSQGAMLTTDVALHYAEPLGGLIVWSGALINEAEWEEKAKQQPPLRVVQSHGRVDPILPIVGGEALTIMLTRNGHLVRYHEFMGQHSIPSEAISMANQLIGDVVNED